MVTVLSMQIRLFISHWLLIAQYSIESIMPPNIDLEIRFQLVHFRVGSECQYTYDNFKKERL